MKASPVLALQPSSDHERVPILDLGRKSTARLAVPLTAEHCTLRLRYTLKFADSAFVALSCAT
jgi:hypothetical protein